MTTSEFQSWLRAFASAKHFVPRSTPRPLVMGVLNVTPDSFSDGGQFTSTSRAIEHAMQMLDGGADLIDVGGESTRPGASRVPASIQLERVAPVIEAIRQRVDAALSIDTTASTVAAAGLRHGAVLVNDVSAGRDDAEMFPLVAHHDAAILLMHMQGTPATMQQHPAYTDVSAEVAAFLCDRTAVAQSAGIASSQILIDPGIGFGKTTEHNLKLLHDLPRLAALGHAMVVGTSRKGFLARVLQNGTTASSEATDAVRLFGTAATVAWSVSNGAAIVRVHDVAPMVHIVRMIEAIRVAE